MPNTKYKWGSKNLICIKIMFVCYTYSFSQTNMVLNSDFEDHDTCTFSTSGIAFRICPYWVDAYITPDYFHSCNTDQNASSPLNFMGFEFPKSGEAYSGIGTFWSSNCLGFTNVREILQGNLTSPLEKDKKYWVEYWVSLADSFGYATNNIGAYFSDTSYDGLIDSPYIYFQMPFNRTPQIINDGSINPLTSKTGWTKIEGSFIAEGGEKYILIGNFNDDANSDTVFIASPVVTNVSCRKHVSYYFIDKVSVYLCEDTVQPPQNLLIPTYIKNEEYFYISSLPANSNLQVYNAIGQLVFKENNYSQKLNTQQLSTGIYFYNLQLPSGEAYRGKVYFER
jgi:hypothetical protein